MLTCVWNKRKERGWDGQPTPGTFVWGRRRKSDRCLSVWSTVQGFKHYTLSFSKYTSSYTIYTKGTKANYICRCLISPQQKRLLKNTFWSYIYISIYIYIYIYRVSYNPVSWLSHWSEQTAGASLRLTGSSKGRRCVIFFIIIIAAIIIIIISRTFQCFIKDYRWRTCLSSRQRPPE